MSFPSFLFALLLALFYGALYHLLRRGGFWRLIFYLVLSCIGFAIGQAISLWQGWAFVMVGPLDVGSASFGSLVALIVGEWLSRIQPAPQSTV